VVKTELPIAREPQAFASLYEAHSRGVYASAYRILGRAPDAEDVTQDVFLRLWREPERFDPARGEIGGYLRMMARSRALDLWRREQSGARARERLKPAGRPDEVDVEDLPEAAAERSEDRATLRAALRRLPLPQRQALLLAYWGGLTADEMARLEGVPFGTARSRIRLGLEKLRGGCAVALASGREGGGG
jgi:RNA polymerase sigma-70 factor (ECF subfamily)